MICISGSLKDIGVKKWRLTLPFGACYVERGLYCISAALVLSNGFWGGWVRGLFCLGKKLLGVAGGAWGKLAAFLLSAHGC